jgi:hypothetical protein
MYIHPLNMSFTNSTGKKILQQFNISFQVTDSKMKLTLQHITKTNGNII